jgi:cytochrome c5
MLFQLNEGRNLMSKKKTDDSFPITPLVDRKKDMTKGKFGGLFMILIIASFLMMAAPERSYSISSQPDQEGSSTTKPAVETTDQGGATLLESRCSVCHSADKPKQAKKTADQWEQTVSRMIGKGAKLTAVEKAALVDYLAKTYGP